MPECLNSVYKWWGPGILRCVGSKSSVKKEEPEILLVCKFLYNIGFYSKCVNKTINHWMFSHILVLMFQASVLSVLLSSFGGYTRTAVVAHLWVINSIDFITIFLTTCTQTGWKWKLLFNSSNQMSIFITLCFLTLVLKAHCLHFLELALL